MTSVICSPSLRTPSLARSNAVNMPVTSSPCLSFSLKPPPASFAPSPVFLRLEDTLSLDVFTESETEDMSDLTCFTFLLRSEISALYLTIASPSTAVAIYVTFLLPLSLCASLPLALPAHPLFPVDRTQSTHGIQWRSCARRIHRV